MVYLKKSQNKRDNLNNGRLKLTKLTLFFEEIMSLHTVVLFIFEDT